jgi:hypothetical protein
MAQGLRITQTIDEDFFARASQELVQTDIFGSFCHAEDFTRVDGTARQPAVVPLYAQYGFRLRLHDETRDRGKDLGMDAFPDKRDAGRSAVEGTIVVYYRPPPFRSS